MPKKSLSRTSILTNLKPFEKSVRIAPADEKVIAEAFYDLAQLIVDHYRPSKVKDNQLTCLHAIYGGLAAIEVRPEHRSE